MEPTWEGGTVAGSLGGGKVPSYPGSTLTVWVGLEHLGSDRCPLVTGAENLTTWGWLWSPE